MFCGACCVLGTCTVGHCQECRAAPYAHGPSEEQAAALFPPSGVTHVSTKTRLLTLHVGVRAGGVIVSFFEWVQNQQTFRWEEEEVSQSSYSILLTFSSHLGLIRCLTLIAKSQCLASHPSTFTEILESFIRPSCCQKTV